VTILTSETNEDPQRLKEFFLARQPILNREQSLIAYELLFRGAGSGTANVTDDLEATASVIAHANELGLGNVIGSALGFVNVDAAVLMSDFVEVLPKNQAVLEILETVVVTPEIVARVAQLARTGFIFALDDVIAHSEDLQKFMPYVSIIKIEITGMGREQLQLLAQQFGGNGKKLLAEKVETLEQFNMCLDLGFDYFQGYYFARPVVMTGRKLSPSQMAIMQLMSLLVADAESSEIEHSIKQDAALGLMLLRLVNTPGLGVTRKIESLSQALIVLGRLQLQRWLQIMLYADSAKSKQMGSPLLVLATSRGKLLELMTEKLFPGKRNMADTAFTVGIMSLMDALFGTPMEELLTQIAVDEDVSRALLAREGLFGDMLKLAEYTERIEECGDMIPEALEALDLTSDELYEIQLGAFEWSENISRGN
jgi:EAL and modified HD-GYP domain-containing signal transduction protein